MDCSQCFLFRLVVLCFFHVVVFGCRGLPMQIGDTTSDAAVEVGSSFEIICALYAKNVEIDGKNYDINSSNLVWMKGKKVLKNVAVLNESSISWKLQDGKVNDSGLYQCFVEVPHTSGISLLVCVTQLDVGYKPLPVLNFSCESINFNNLTCQWTIPYNPVKANYSLKRYLSYHTVRCPDETATASSCWWGPFTKPPFPESTEKLHFVLTGKNNLGVKTQHFSMSHYKIVRPGSPRLIVSVHNNNASLVFRPPSDMEHIAPPHPIILQYQLCLTTRDISEFCEIFVNQHEVHMELIPFQEYHFKLRCKSQDTEDDMWGPFSKIQSINTQADVPYLAPAAASSLFHSEVVGNTRVVNVYWERVPRLHHNGPNFCYRLSYYPCKSSVIKKEILECKRNYLQIKNLAVNMCYTFRICPTNDVGMSSNCSYVNIEEASKCE